MPRREMEDSKPPSHILMKKYPAWIKELGMALRKANKRIERNFLDQDLRYMHPMEVIQIPKSHQKSIAALCHRKGINTMQKLVPTLVERREGGAPMWETILQTEGRVTSARMEEHVNRDMDNYHRGMSRYLANSMNTIKRTEGDLRGHVLGVFARSTFTPLRDPTTRHTYNIRDHASTKSATDGSNSTKPIFRGVGVLIFGILPVELTALVD